MTGILAAVGFLLVIYGLKSGGNPLAALAASIGVKVHGDTILPNGQPAQMTAAQWTQWKQAIITKYKGTKVASGAVTAAEKYYTESEDAWFQASLDTRQLQRQKSATMQWIPDTCGSGGGGPGTLLTATARTGQVTGLTTQAVQTAGTSGAAVIGSTLAKSIPVVGSIIGGITAIIGIFGANHAKAEAQETAYLCSLVPQANAALADIDTRFRAGQVSTPQAHDELENLYANFVAAIAPINKAGGAGFSVLDATWASCNAACNYCTALRMICDVREQVDY